MLAAQVTHGGDNFRRTAPCPLCFSQVAARELRLFTARQVTPIQVGPPWLLCMPLYLVLLMCRVLFLSGALSSSETVALIRLQVGDSVQFALLRRPRNSIIPHEVCQQALYHCAVPRKHVSSYKRLARGIGDHMLFTGICTVGSGITTQDCTPEQ
jgi:hypothetical protein